MADVIFNKNELILDRIRNVAYHDLETKKLLLRLTSVEDPSLNCTAEGEEILDAVGALITTLYRAKKATFSGSNSLVSLDLAAAQYGSKKVVAGIDKDDIEEFEKNTAYKGAEKITTYAYETIKVDGTSVKLAYAPNVDSIKYIYNIENGEIGTAFVAGSAASETEFVVAEDGTITLPTGVTSGTIYVEYTHESENANRVINRTTDFPAAGRLVIYAYFRDKCTEKLYSGAIICPKAKLNPESVELALTATGKHPFEFTMMKDYCSDDDELFSIIVNK
jgi:hypothetical protein